MNCALFERQVPHWISGELDPSTSVAMDAHSIECAGCKALTVFERETRALIHEAGRGPSAPAHLRERILAELPLEAFPAQETSNGLKVWHLAPLAAEK